MSDDIPDWDNIPADIQALQDTTDALWRLLCGCGEPQTAVGFVRKILEACSTRDWSKSGLAMDGEHAGAYWTALYAIGNADLIEHGANIMFSWPTPVGEKALRLLNEYGNDPDDWPCPTICSRQWAYVSESGKFFERDDVANVLEPA